MGSILAETIDAEHIEHIIKPVKDLFGAIFFVSVGMLIDPALVMRLRARRTDLAEKNAAKKLRLEKGLTQLSLQMQTGIEQSLISKYENGERVPPTETLMQLADFYGVSMDYIMGRTDRKEINR